MGSMRTRAALWRPVVQVEARGALRIVRIAGRLGAAGASDGAVRDALSPERTSRGDLVIDLTQVDYVSSAGIRLIENVVEQARRDGAQVVLCGIADAVRTVLTLAGTLDRVASAATIDEAVVRVAGAAPTAEA